MRGEQARSILALATLVAEDWDSGYPTPDDAVVAVVRDRYDEHRGNSVRLLLIEARRLVHDLDTGKAVEVTIHPDPYGRNPS